MKDFIDYLEGRGYASNTVNLYVYAVMQLSERVPEMTDQALLEHKDWLIATFSPKTANNRIGAINVYLDFIGYKGMRLKGIKVQQKPFLDNVITNEQYEMLKGGLKAEEDWFWYYVVRVLACTGARVSELQQLKVTHIKAGYIDIISKGQKLRRIWIPKPVCDEVAGWCKQLGREEGPLFPGPMGSAMSTRGIALGLKRAAERHGVDPSVVYPHSFRHLFAKNFIARNPDIALLADLMGHESIETTRIYLRRSASEQRDAVDMAINW
ncbi:integrase [Olsenella sp. TM06-36]|uniref:tyrosine-type recombinase/integrase n=1 Tax=unclassified Olsenella TaxID=2638792 RepID=UPI000E4399F0|nr:MULTISPECIES: tyrosine-type recombinase/integrase [unclassified Olsenella]RGJ47746.1 integrase [Olsenella sp. TM06-36]RHJ94430.1 integrase [Olsenella sp. AM05-7]RHJ95933.1 integrase [Olsenella sp. AM05-17]